MASSPGPIAEQLATLPLIDHHVHGCWVGDVDRVRFENALNEANTEPVAADDAPFDSQIGFAVRRWCAPVLGLPAHAAADVYWDRRERLSEDEVSRTFLPAAGVSNWIVDTGLPGVADPDTLARWSGAAAHEVIRLESIAEEAVARGGNYAAAFDEILAHRAATAVGTKSIIAYRGGFDGDLTDPEPVQVEDAARRWRDAGGRRVTDRTLLRFGLHRGLRLGKPLQLHVGLGDRDADLHRTNPLLLLDFLRGSGTTPVMLLHCYPFEREAGYLAQAFSNVYIDVGLAVNHLGARASELIARSLELAPFRKVLYSSDAFGPAELHYLGAQLWRHGLATVLQRFVDADAWALDDALRVAEMIAHGNARRVYGLTGNSTHD
ncbi:amidohydrolase family protein [Gordonia sp. HNM0687]|uniref:Amidohydrolase family protein n=1 Tax=Gordonia mangrovi TaxID=2665643 RepID=A0A6L7GKB8_9ACTN|nr:amidohydrolase family protein [Gordonia mangrovi]MXP20359.1 amidohydrolase family protein [Gordonia mangrovi]UVF79040.1 amidohydrolase family protein [Gordonia mangrovi]